ncbi:zinc-dependent alcohol dehydrogenase [Paraburkholderia sacchari]|uniref:zinc-dependent alcohol dehydrogenase n=1 Tax=Paraburkholderia sacchari TaxID=159450 RepID=UPI0005428F23|nr:zinc-binding dehydrogenase [Paraburkholderia sacchari]NLP64907.1 zinc-binding dehydrogenase [Paraburkholderia sacchari]
MKAAVFHDPGQLEMRTDLRAPEPGPNEVIVKVSACGICGSDLHLYRTNAHRGPSLLWTSPEGYEVPGHEYSGTIVGTGSNITDWHIGERVVGVTGGGGFAEYVRVPVNPFQLVRVPDAVSFAEAATTEPLADGLQMVRKANVQPGENVVVYGVGIIGLGVIQALKAMNVRAKQIIAVDVSDSRLAMAVEVGATAVVNPRVDEPIARIGQICGTVPTEFPPMNPPDVAAVIDCAGFLKHMDGPPPLQQALHLLRPKGGRIVCFGAYEDKFPIDFMPVIHKEIAIYGSMGYSPADLEKALDLMASGELDRKRLISHRLTLEHITEAFEVQGSPEAIKVMVTID